MDAKTERLEDLTRLLIKHNAAEVQHRIANSEQCPRFDCAKWLCNASQVYKYDENTKACTSMTPRHGHRSSHHVTPFCETLQKFPCSSRSPHGSQCSRSRSGRSTVLYIGLRSKGTSRWLQQNSNREQRIWFSERNVHLIQSQSSSKSTAHIICDVVRAEHWVSQPWPHVLLLWL